MAARRRHGSGIGGVLGKKMGDLTLSQAFAIFAAVGVLYTLGTRLLPKLLAPRASFSSAAEPVDELTKLQRELDECIKENRALRAELPQQLTAVSRELHQFHEESTLRRNPASAKGVKSHEPAATATRASNRHKRLTAGHKSGPAKAAAHAVRTTPTNAPTALVESQKPVHRHRHRQPPKGVHPAPAPRPPKAAIVYLTTNREKDLKDLERSLRSVHTNLLSLYRYPVYIFHEGNLDTKLQARIKKPFTHKLQMHFFAVELKAPASVKLNTLHAQARGWKARPSEWGYNHMIRGGNTQGFS